MPLRNSASAFSLCKEIFYKIFGYAKQFTVVDVEAEKVPYKNIRSSSPEVFFKKDVLHRNSFEITFAWVFSTPF